MFKKKEEIVVIAVLAIITSALLSGYGVYYFLNLRTKAIVPSSPQKTKHSLEIETKEQSNTDGELQAAQKVLENFFSYLNNKQYEEAAVLYAWGHDDDPGNNLQAWMGTNNAETLKNYCEAVDTCLRIKVLTGVQTNDNEHTFVVQFLTDEGKAYEYSPVVGVKATTNFNFKVKKINSQFKVVNPPLYRS